MPSEWSVAKLADLLLQRPTYGINARAVPYDLRLPAYIRITDITEDGKFNPDGRTSVAHPDTAAYRLTDDDIVLARTGASTGKSYLYRAEDGELVYAGFLIKIVPDQNKLLSVYLRYQLQTSAYWRWIRANSMRSGQPGINGQQYAQLLIPLPPTTNEQRAIAEALSDADALIESLERLIAKKRALKQGAMQELLTGKLRLPGFNDAWEEKLLGAIAPLQRGFDLPTSKRHSGPFPVVYSNGILGFHTSFQVRGPGVVTGRSGTIGTVTYVSEDFWPHNTSLWVTDFRHNNPRFVFYLYAYVGLERFATGSGVPTLNRNDVHAYRVSIPPSATEQGAIAQVLTDLDTEIGLLEDKVAKARQIKQGMMQELLTGRVRLV